MGATYTQIYIQLIFAVKYLKALIGDTWNKELHYYIGGIIKGHRHRLLEINGTEDHLHLLIGYKPYQSLSELMKNVKGSSSKWINERKFTEIKFRWQDGFGAFSYSQSDLERVKKFILNQADYHIEHTFIEEYRTLLKAFKVEYDERYILREPV